METRRGVLREQITQTLAEHLPGLPISAVLLWDSRLAQRAEDTAKPVAQPALLRALNLMPAPSKAGQPLGERTG